MRARFFRATAMVALVSMSATPVAHAASLTIFHNNDGESSLVPATGFPGAARFYTALDQARTAANGAGRDVLTISSGDNFLASSLFTASLNSGVYYDAQMLARVNYDAVVLGNHEFDFGPQVLADFIGQSGANTTFLSANLDFSGESSLQALVSNGRIAKSKVVTRGSETYAIVSATTESLPIIASPGNVVVNPVVAAVQAEIDALQAQGINKIIFASHLQAIDIDVATIAALRGVDIVIAGGADPLLTNSIPQGGTDAYGLNPLGPYPLTQYNGTNGYSGPAIVDADGNAVPLISTAGNYRYVGAFEAEFDAAGKLTSFGGNPILVDNSFAADAVTQTTIVDPAAAAVAAQAANIVGTSEVALDARNANIRTRETNLGSLVADAYIFATQQAALSNPALLRPGNVLISFTNGGGIRTNSLVAAGNLSEKQIIDLLPFANFLSVLNDVTPVQLKALLEYAVGAIPSVNGRFAQIGGFSFTYNPNAAVGDRINQILLPDGTVVYSRLSGQFANVLFDLSTIDFLIRGGDGYPFAALGLTNLVNVGATYQSSLFDYLQFLGGTVLASQYPEAGLGRIAQAATAAVDEPGALGLAALGFAGALLLRRRRQAVAA